MARRKRYEVEKIEGKCTRLIKTPKMTKNRKGEEVPAGGFDEEPVEVDAGWMVYLPSGASLAIRTELEMKRLGFNINGPEDKMEDYEEGDYKELSKRKTSQSKGRPAANV